jgi:hypothetical protein
VSTAAPGPVARAARAFFESDGWVVAPDDGSGTIYLAYRGSHGQWGCLVVPREEGRQLLFYSVCPREAPEEARPRVAEYLGRVNWGMPIGNFEMDFLSGEIRFRTSVAFESLEPTVELIRPLAYANVFTMDQYLEDIGEVIDGSLDADTPDHLRMLRGNGPR